MASGKVTRGNDLSIRYSPFAILPFYRGAAPVLPGIVPVCSFGPV
jgi:hypothetical protein